MDDAQLLRYSRHILLSELGVDAQERFAASHALVVGIGGLGNPVTQFLGAAGVGTLTLIDADRVDLTNLQRQILFDTGAVGRSKVEAAQARIAAVNPEVRIVTVSARVGRASLPRWSRPQMSSSTAGQLRDAARRQSRMRRREKPLVSGAAIRFEGQISVFDARDPRNPCYHCLFGEGDEFEETRCATMGVFAPLVGIIGATQAAEALKLLAPAGRSLAGRLLLLDALEMQWREVRVLKDPACPVCGAGAH
jgi:adenylyltransferase/sulfurtransferase